MITILHYCSSYHPFNGNIFYNFEYFIFLIKQNIEVELVIISDLIKLDTILEVMDDRYELENVNYKPYIKFSFYYSEDKYDKVITNSKTFYDLKGIIHANEIHMVYTWASFFKEFQLNFSHYNNIKIYNECELCGNVNYIRPLYLDLLKKPTESTNDIFLHLSGVRSLTMREYIIYVIPHLRASKQIIVSFPKSQKKSLDYLTKLVYIEIHENHTPNLFSKFGTYFYIMLKGIDYSPRMLIESFYLEKEIIFIDKTNFKHGGHTRYNDILNNNIEKYKLTMNDLLIKNIING